MKALFAYYVILISCFSFSSCKKNDATNHNYTNVVGFWKGKTGTGTVAPNTDIAILFKGDGTMRVYNNSSDTASARKVDDLYYVNSNIINMSYLEAGNAYSTKMQGTINTNFTRIDGTRGVGAAVTGEGTFYLMR